MLSSLYIHPLPTLLFPISFVDVLAVLIRQPIRSILIIPITTKKIPFYYHQHNWPAPNIIIDLYSLFLQSYYQTNNNNNNDNDNIDNRGEGADLSVAAMIGLGKLLEQRHRYEEYQNQLHKYSLGELLQHCSAKLTDCGGKV